MRIDWYTLALQTVNFAVLVWLLHRVLYRPVLRMVDARRTQIDAECDAARKTTAEAREQQGAITAERSLIAAERARVLASAAAEADTLKHDRQLAAEREVAALLDTARKTLASERERALNDAQGAALDLAGEFLARLLAGLPREFQAEAWLGRIESHLNSLPACERDALAHQLSAASPLTVVTASALEPQALEMWRERLSRAVGGDALSFAVDPAVGAGAELQFPGATLSFSLRSAVAALQGELERRAPSASQRH